MFIQLTGFAADALSAGFASAGRPGVGSSVSGLPVVRP
jgi:hypothetical protein